MSDSALFPYIYSTIKHILPYNPKTFLQWAMPSLVETKAREGIFAIWYVIKCWCVAVLLNDDSRFAVVQLLTVRVQD